MDSYERLTAINESLMGRIKRYLTTPRAVKQFERAVADLDRRYSDLPENQPKPNQPKRKNNRAVANFERMVADLDRKYSNQNESTEAERIDQAGARGKQALEDAGIKFKFRPGIGSMNREDNHYIVSSKDVKAAERALKGVSNAQVKTK